MDKNILTIDRCGNIVTYILRSVVNGHLCTGSGSTESEAIDNHERAVINCNIMYGNKIRVVK